MKLKSTISTLLLALATSLSFGQSEPSTENSTRKNDIFIDPIFLITVPLLNVSYERLVSEDLGIGIHGLLGLESIEDIIQISPFARMYFGADYASGFYLEGFIPVTTTQEDVYTYDSQGDYYNSDVRRVHHTTAGLGVGLGGKWVLKRNLLFELGLGVARRFGQKGNGEPITGKWMIGVGYRF